MNKSDLLHEQHKEKIVFNLAQKFVVCSQGLNRYYENKCVRDF
jgi:hypothetical protein